MGIENSRYLEVCECEMEKLHKDLKSGWRTKEQLDVDKIDVLS